MSKDKKEEDKDKKDEYVNTPKKGGKRGTGRLDK